ncbi:MAG: M48 family metallopeptidase [Gammaproteobacteria bacterium]|nr:M48 family metallopeptidase [Gammaproteobacteria bacterium]
MQTFKAKLFGAELPLTGMDVEAYFSGESLRITTMSIVVNTNDISPRVGGFEHDDLFLNWRTADDISYALKPTSKNDTALVIANAPPSLQKQFKQWHQRKSTIKWVWGTLATVTVVFILSISLLWWRYDQAISWVTDQVSIKNEEKLGNSVLEQIESEGDIIKTGLAADAVKQIGTRLTKDSKFHYRWFIQKDKKINAFALPGGIIIINSGLITKTDNAEELAAVLAHEVQHVEQRHALKNMIKSMGWAAGLMLVLGDVNAATAVIAHQMGNMYFSREVEAEADRLGYQNLIKANILPSGMVTLLQKLEKENRVNKTPQWLSSHPDIAERIKKIEALHAQQPCPACKPLTLDWKKIQQDKMLLRKDI